MKRNQVQVVFYMKKAGFLLISFAIFLCCSLKAFGQEKEGEKEVPPELRQLYAQSAVLM